MYRLANSDIPVLLNDIVNKPEQKLPNKIFELKLHLKKVLLYH